MSSAGHEAKGRITILSENSVTSPGDLIGEHGFSALIERKGSLVLFDTGRGFALPRNARALGVDLTKIDCIVLSHGHSDHTGGLKDLLLLTGPRPVHAHPGVFAARHWREPNGVRHPIGMPFTRSELEKAGARFVLGAEPVEVAEGIHTTGSIPRITPFETGDASLFLEKGTETIPDTHQDDLSLVLAGTDGLAVVLGCAHAGLVNILRRVLDLFPGEAVRLVVGGTHLGFCGSGQMEGTIDALREMGVAKVGAGHCTGLAGAARLRQGLGEDRFFFAGVGTVVEF